MEYHFNFEPVGEKVTKQDWKYWQSLRIYKVRNMITLQEKEYRAIKRELKNTNVSTLAKVMKRSVAVVTKVKSTKNYAEYKALVKSEHIPSKKPKSLGKRVAQLEQQVAQLMLKGQRKWWLGK